MGDKTKIDWCDASWNPVTGCLHGCKYCYARKIAERFGLKYAPKLGDPGMEGACKYDTEELGQNTMLELEKPYVDRDGVKSPYPMTFLPTFHKYRLDIPQKWKTPRNIFVCSMADLFGKWVSYSWIEQIFESCYKTPQHRYLFLTKNPDRYRELKKLLPDDANFWFGYSATNNDENWRFTDVNDPPVNHLFVSIEPILSRINPSFIQHVPADWVIIGAETGNRKGKVVPEKDWIAEIAEECDLIGVPVFMKESLRELMGNDFRQAFPFETNTKEAKGNE